MSVCSWFRLQIPHTVLQTADVVSLNLKGQFSVVVIKYKHILENIFLLKILQLHYAI